MLTNILWLKSLLIFDKENFEWRFYAKGIYIKTKSSNYSIV